MEEHSRVVGRPRKACDPCHFQKIRCSGERHGCTRCRRLSRPCIWTTSSKITERRKRKTSESRLNRAFELIRGAPHDPSTTFEDVNVEIATPLLDQSSTYGVPEPLTFTLVDLYFETAYNAQLLLQKQSFLESLHAGEVASHVVLSICAWAANFYHDSNGRQSLKEDGFMTEWANQAGNLVLAQAHTFDEENVVTYCTLALFWFTQGSWRTAMLYKANAFALYQALGVKKNALPGESALQAELRRRRFWACFLLECHSMCELPAVRGITDPHTIPLPWPGSALNAGYSSDPPLYLKSSQDRLGSLYAHFIRGIHIWSSIASLMRDAGGNGLDIHQLEEDITQWWNMAYFSSTIGDCWIDNSMDYVHKLLIRLVYHQSILAINAWRVPLFSGIEHRGSFSTDAALQISAQAALEHAAEISSLAAQILQSEASDRILMALPSFPSYAAFCSCTIQLHFIHCKVPNVGEKFAMNISRSLQVLRGMAKYWKSAKLMAAFVDVLSMLYSQADTHLETEPKSLTDAAPLRVPPSSHDYPLPSSILEFVPFFRPLNGDGILPSDQEWPPNISMIRTRLQDKTQGSQRTALLTPSTVDEFYNPHDLQRNESDFEPLVSIDDAELMDFFSGLGSLSEHLDLG